MHIYSTIKLWDTNKGLNVKTLKGHTYSVLCLCLLKNGYFASGSADTHIKIWTIEADSASRCIKTFSGHSNSINSLCLINDHLASASNDKTIKIWSMNGDLIRTLTGHKDYVVTLCPLSEYLLASGSLDSYIKIFDLQTGEVIKNITDHFDWITCLALFKNSKYFASSSNDDTIKIWSL
jgi:WD40 repeat protein